MFRRRLYHPLAKLIGSYLCLALWAYVTKLMGGDGTGRVQR